MEGRQIHTCGRHTVTDLLELNAEITDVALHTIGDTTTYSEVLFITQKRGPVYLFNVFAHSEMKDMALDYLESDRRSFRHHSCLNANAFCDVTSVTPLETGFLAIDRHRLMQFNLSWSVPEEPERLVHTIGQMNSITPRSDDRVDFLHPTAVAVYKPYNATHVGEFFEMTPHMPHAGSRLLFVTDTGNHRVVMLNATVHDQVDYVGQFGVTGERRSDTSGLSWPYGIAVKAPAYESQFEPVFANVFVADRQNNRIVKFNVGYEITLNELQYFDADSEQVDQVELGTDLGLRWGGEYGSFSTARANETLHQPVGVALYRHYIFVAEALGNAITVLTMHHERWNEFIFVTQFQPALGVQLTGHLAISQLGYVWYTFLEVPSDFGVASFFLPSELRLSDTRSILDDYIAQCVNETWYNQVLLANRTFYVNYVGRFLTAAEINWMFPQRPGYRDVMSFNITYLGDLRFDLESFNRTVFNGQMRLCAPPPPSTTPAMASGNQAGWSAGGMASRINAAARPSAAWCATGLWLLAAGLAQRGVRASAG